MASVTAFLEKRLRLRVNRDKSAVAHVSERKFLGHRLLAGGRLGIAPKSLERAKDRIRQITRRKRGISFKQTTRSAGATCVRWTNGFVGSCVACVSSNGNAARLLPTS
jgi:RNA-directed DNA polymerase